MSNSADLVTERKKAHGGWFDQSLLASLIKSDLHGAPRWHLLSASQKEALDMIAVKISRIVSGDPSHADHWDDIMGYALLGKGGDHPAQQPASTDDPQSAAA